MEKLTGDEAIRVLNYLQIRRHLLKPEIDSALAAVRAEIHRDTQARIAGAAHGVDETIWARFQNPHLQKEIARLSPEEWQYVDEIAQDLARDIDLFQIVCSVPHGSEDLAKRDQFWSCRIDQKGTPIDLKTLGVELVNSMPTDFQDAIVEPSTGGHNIIQIFNHPREDGKIIIRCKTRTPQNVSSISDKRSGSNYYRLILPRVALQRFLETPKVPLWLWPFILRNAAAILHPKAAQVFFDVPMQGDGLLDEDDNPVTMLDYGRRHIVHYASTRHHRTAPAINEHFSTDTDFIKKALGFTTLFSIQDEQSEKAKERFLLTGARGYDWPDASVYL